jgi:hypothetical protein
LVTLNLKSMDGQSFNRFRGAAVAAEEERIMEK